jgi:hypothetical protein
MYVSTPTLPHHLSQPTTSRTHIIVIVIIITDYWWEIHVCKENLLNRRTTNDEWIVLCVWYEPSAHLFQPTTLIRHTLGSTPPNSSTCLLHLLLQGEPLLIRCTLGSPPPNHAPVFWRFPVNSNAWWVGMGQQQLPHAWAGRVCTCHGAHRAGRSLWLVGVRSQWRTM